VRAAERLCTRPWLKRRNRPEALAASPRGRILAGHDGSVTCVAFSPDGWTLASGSHRTVRLWDTATGALRQTLAGHAAEVKSVAFAPDGRTLASGSWDQTVRLWEVATGKPLAWLPCDDRVLALWFDPVLPQLRVADAGGAAHVPRVYLLEIVHP